MPVKAEDLKSTQATELRSKKGSEKARFREVFGSLPLFDDMFLRMQAMNMDIIDEFLEEQEIALLKKSIEIERTPLPEMLFVSALSQLWVFGLYELLRTWRQRVDELLRFVRAAQGLPISGRKKFVDQKRLKIRELSEHALQSPWRSYAKGLRSPKFIRELENAHDRSELTFRRIEALRVALAKHELPKSKGVFAMTPGYGRIDGSTGSINWQIVLRGREVDSVSRRRIADDCRAISADYSQYILPRHIQAHLAGFPEHTFATKRIDVTLKDKRTFDGVIVAWSKQIVFVEGQVRMPFDAGEIIAVRSSPRPIATPKKAVSI